MWACSLIHFLFIVTLHRNLQNRSNLAWLCILRIQLPQILLESYYRNHRIICSSEKNKQTSESSSLIAVLFPLAQFSCQERPGCNQSGSWWSLAVTGWSWAPQWRCTSSRSCCTGWDSRCWPAASSSRCRETRKDGEKVIGHWQVDVCTSNIYSYDQSLLEYFFILWL